jgi:hypothetical protein
MNILNLSNLRLITLLPDVCNLPIKKLNMNSYAIIMIGYKSVDNITNRINEAYADGSPNEFILIINHYSEESYKILEYAKNEPRITRYIYCSQNIGFAKAMNLGASIARSDNLIIANDDCSTNANTHMNLSEALKEEKNELDHNTSFFVFSIKNVPMSKIRLLLTIITH